MLIFEMRNQFLVFSIVALLSSCGYVTKKEEKPVSKPYSEMTPEEKLADERSFVENVAALYYLDQSTVVGDTMYIGCMSRRGEEHFQDNLAKALLHDVRKKGYTHIRCCRVISTSHDHVWTDTLVQGRTIGYAME
jgi:hypothetical protein